MTAGTGAAILPANQSLVSSPADALSDTDRASAARLSAEAPALAATVAERLALLLRERSAGTPGDVLAAAGATLLAPLVTGSHKDAAAVQTALDTPWITGPVEGRINRIETMERSIDGRAGVLPLRDRVLNAA